MSESSGKTYRPWEPERYQHEAQSPAAKLLPRGLGFFLLDTVRRLDLRRSMPPMNRKRGRPAFDPAMMVCLLLYAYCVECGEPKSALPANAIWPSSPLEARSAQTFARQRFPPAPSGGVQGHLCACVRLAGEAGLVRLGNVAIDARRARQCVGTRRGVMGICRRQWSGCARKIEALVTQAYSRTKRMTRRSAAGGG